MTTLNKRADITMSTVVTVIMVILGFVLLLIIYSNLDLGKGASKEACYQSVLFRATASTLSLGTMQNSLPLKCYTENVCFTSGLIAGECKEYKNKPNVLSYKVNSVDQIEQIIADKTVDCWSMLGEGKISLFNQFWAQTYGLGGVYPSCVVCSRFAFDTVKLNRAGIKLADINMFEFISTHKIPGRDITYAEYLSGGGASISFEGLLQDSSATPEQIAQNAEATKKQLVDTIERAAASGVPGLGVTASLAEDFKNNPASIFPPQGDIKLVEPSVSSPDQELSLVFTQISAPTHGGVLMKTLATGAAFLGITKPKVTAAAGATAATATATAGGTAAGSLTSLQEATGPWQVGAPAVKTGLLTRIKTGIFSIGRAASSKLAAAGALFMGYQQASVAKNRYIASSYCGDMEVGGGERNGCSIVRLVNYNLTEIDRYCDVVESISS